MAKEEMVTKYQVTVDGKPVRFYTVRGERKIFFDPPFNEFGSEEDARKRCALYNLSEFELKPVQRHKPEVITELKI